MINTRLRGVLPAILAKRMERLDTDRMKTVFLSILLFACLNVHAGEFLSKIVEYEIDGQRYESTIIWHAGGEARPGVLMVPNWMGPTDQSLEKAQKVAAMGFVVMMVDMYGVEVRPQNGKEAGAAATAVRADRAIMRKRVAEALAVFTAESDIPLEPQKMAAIGFCFGGGAVLEFARSGAVVDAVISFHGDLMSPTLATDSKNIQSRVLVLHGADDPVVPQEEVTAFISSMQDTEVDWQLVQFSKTVHSFTNPYAMGKGAARYNPASSARSFEYMEELLEELWGED